MGLLDDAIREHLELKRRHGATDEEIVRAEQEALTPARRDAAGAGVPPLQEVPGEEIEAAEPPPPPPPPPVEDPVFADEYATEPAPADTDEPVDEPEPVAPPVVFDEPDPDAAPEPVFEHVAHVPEPELEPEPEEAPVSDPAPEPEPSPEPPDRARTSILDDPLADGPPAENEDVLEETPEFLQDAPEHDKLWFEQKPPRDFDFE